jgi:hypothetical protein
MKRILLLLACLLIACPAWAAPVFDATTEVPFDAGVSTLSGSHTRGGGCTNSVAIVDVAVSAVTLPTVTGVTYGGVAMTSVLTEISGSGEQRIHTWIFINPPSSSQTVTATLSGNALITMAIRTYCNVHQTTPTGTAVSASGSGDLTATVDVSSATGELVVDAVISSNTDTLTVGAGQTEQDNIPGASGHVQAGSDEPGAGTVTMDWTIGGSQYWAMVGVALKAVAGAGPTPRVRTIVVE